MGAVRTVATLTVLAGLLAGCGSEGPTDGPRPGHFRASLTTPNTADGALLVRIVGEISNLEALGGHRVASTVNGTTTRLVLTGNLGAGDVLRFAVPDVRRLSSYLIVVEQAADRNSYALLDTAGYSLTLRVE